MPILDYFIGACWCHPQVVNLNGAGLSLRGCYYTQQLCTWGPWFSSQAAKDQNQSHHGLLQSQKEQGHPRQEKGVVVWSNFVPPCSTNGF